MAKTTKPVLAEPSQGKAALRVLIVEDETIVGMGLRAQLTKLGHVVAGHAATVAEARANWYRRKNAQERLRQQVATEMSRVQAQLDGMLVDRPRRQIIRVNPARNGGSHATVD